MDDKKGYYFLLKDVENPQLCDNDSWWGVFSSYVYSSEDAQTQAVQAKELALRGEILEALEAEEQPADCSKIALRGVKQLFLRVECAREDLKLISDADTQLLLAVHSYSERWRIFNEGHLSLGGTIREGTEVNVWIKELHRDVAGVVRYKGPVPPYDGTMFGVELLDHRYRRLGTCNGSIQCQRYFKCEQGCGLFVALDKLRVKHDNGHLSDSLPAEEEKTSDRKDSGELEACQKERERNKAEKIKQVAEETTSEEYGLERKVAADLLECEGRVSKLEISSKENDDSYVNGKLSDNVADDVKNDKEDNLEASESKLSLEVEDLTQQLFEVKLELSEKEKKSKQNVQDWEEKLGEERAAKREAQEEVTRLQEAVEKQKQRTQEVQERLLEEQKSWKQQRKAFYREWEDFEKRLVEERAERTSIEKQLPTVQRELEDERTSKGELQEELERARSSAREDERDFQRQRESLEWRVRELESAPRANHVGEVVVQNEPRDWIISRDEVHVTDKSLGIGGWGQVLQGNFRGCKVAVKRIHDLILSPHNRRLFEREMSMASRCRHPCLLQFIGATNDDGTPLFVTELLDTNLRAVLETRALKEAEIVSITLDVAKALNYLHLNKPLPIIHRDISSANVLLWRREDCWRAKVSDYGAANFMRQCRTINPGAVIYSAPEAFSVEQTTKIDVYSFGLLLCEMCIRELPVPEHTRTQVSMVTNLALRDVIMRCVQQEHGKRPNMEEIIQDLEKL